MIPAAPSAQATAGEPAKGEAGGPFEVSDCNGVMRGAVGVVATDGVVAIVGVVRTDGAAET